MADDKQEFIGVLANFGSEIGSTLEDLTLHWEDDDNGKNLKAPMEGFPSHGAKPLNFTNPVYLMFNVMPEQDKGRKMTLIPLSQFDINQDDAGKSSRRQSKKHRKESFMHSITGFMHRKNSVRKRSIDQPSDISAPLWSDTPTVMLDSSPHERRSSDHVRRRESIQDEKTVRSASLEPSGIIQSVGVISNRKPPPKSPRLSRGTASPLVSPVDENKKITDVRKISSSKMEDAKIRTSDDGPMNQEPTFVVSDLKEDLNLKKIESVSDMPEVQLEDEEVKTMAEVMTECDSDATISVDDVTKNMESEEMEIEEGKLKRNKTVKWAGSRHAPTLIREFTKKNKNKRSHSFENLLSMEATPTSAPVTPNKTVSTDDVINLVEAVSNDDLTTNIIMENDNKNKTKDKRDTTTFTVLSLCLPPAPKLRRSGSSKIRAYLQKMGSNQQFALGYAVSAFVEQTIKNHEERPLVLLHNIRSFLTDIKRYLMTNPHVGLMKKIQRFAKDSSVVDIEGAIDDSLDRLVLYPLRNKIYKCLVVDYAKSKQLDRIKEAQEIAKSKTAKELGIRETLIPPTDEALKEINQHFIDLQATYSPYYKLKYLLSAVTSIYQHTRDKTCEDESARHIGADDFLPLLVYSVVKCDFIAADIEAQYVDGLLDPVLLLGEGGYYLTTLFSAVQVLSSMRRKETPLPHISDLQSFLKVGISATDKVISPKLSDGIPLYKTLHVPPSMTARSLCAMIARKYDVLEPDCYCLHVVVNKVAHELKPNEFPQLVKMDLMCQFDFSSFYFVYQRKSEHENVEEADALPESSTFQFPSTAAEDIVREENNVKGCEEKFENDLEQESIKIENNKSETEDKSPKISHEVGDIDNTNEVVHTDNSEKVIEECQTTEIKKLNEPEQIIDPSKELEQLTKQMNEIEQILETEVKFDSGRTNQTEPDYDDVVEQSKETIEIKRAEPIIAPEELSTSIENNKEENLKASDSCSINKEEDIHEIDENSEPKIEERRNMGKSNPENIKTIKIIEGTKETLMEFSVENNLTVKKPDFLFDKKQTNSSPRGSPKLLSPIPVEELPSPPPLRDIDDLPTPPSIDELTEIKSTDTSPQRTKLKGAKSADNVSLSYTESQNLSKEKDPSEMSVSTLRQYFESKAPAQDLE